MIMWMEVTGRRPAAVAVAAVAQSNSGQESTLPIFAFLFQICVIMS